MSELPDSQDPVKLKLMEEIEQGEKVVKCPTCKENNLKVRKSIYGSFLGCEGYPKCRYTEKLTAGPLKEDFIKKPFPKNF